MVDNSTPRLCEKVPSLTAAPHWAFELSVTNFGRIPPRNPQSYIQPELPVIEPTVAEPVARTEEQTHWLEWAGLVAVLGSAAVIAAAFGFHW